MRSNYEEFVQALQEDNFIEIERLLKQGIDPNSLIKSEIKNKSATVTALPIAKSSNTVALLLEYGADPNILIYFKSKKMHLLTHWIENFPLSERFAHLELLLAYKPYSLKTAELNHALLGLLTKLKADNDLSKDSRSNKLIIALIKASADLTVPIFLQNCQGLISPFKYAASDLNDHVLSLMLQYNFSLQEQLAKSNFSKPYLKNEHVSVLASSFASTATAHFFECLKILHLMKCAFSDQKSKLSGNYLPVEFTHLIFFKLVILKGSITDEYANYLVQNSAPRLQLDVFKKTLTILYYPKKPPTDYLAKINNTSPLNFDAETDGSDKKAKYAWSVTKAHYEKFHSGNEELKSELAEWFSIKKPSFFSRKGKDLEKIQDFISSSLPEDPNLSKDSKYIPLL